MNFTRITRTRRFSIVIVTHLTHCVKQNRKIRRKREKRGYFIQTDSRFSVFVLCLNYVRILSAVSAGADLIHWEVFKVGNRLPDSGECGFCQCEICTVIDEGIFCEGNVVFIGNDAA